MSSVWGRSGSVEGVNGLSSRAVGFEMSVLNALVGMGEKGKEREPNINFENEIFFRIDLKAGLENL